MNRIILPFSYSCDRTNCCICTPLVGNSNYPVSMPVRVKQLSFPRGRYVLQVCISRLPKIEQICFNENIKDKAVIIGNKSSLARAYRYIHANCHYFPRNLSFMGSYCVL